MQISDLQLTTKRQSGERGNIGKRGERGENSKKEDKEERIRGEVLMRGRELLRARVWVLLEVLLQVLPLVQVLVLVPVLAGGVGDEAPDHQHDLALGLNRLEMSENLRQRPADMLLVNLRDFPGHGAGA